MCIACHYVHSQVTETFTWIDLQIVSPGAATIFKETIHRIHDFPGQHEEPFTGNTAIIQTLLSFEVDKEATP